MFNNQPRNIGSMAAVTPAVKFLLIANVAVFLIEQLFRIPLGDYFALPSLWWKTFAFWKLFTYMFVHANSTHLLMNMLGLFFIGPVVEQTVGTRRFYMIYFVSGILGGLGWSLLAQPFSALNNAGQIVLEYPSCVGASGAIMGILGAFGALYPKAELLLWFILPIRAWVLVSLLVLWELYETISVHKIGGIANAAHLVGGIAGFCYAMTLKHPHLVAGLKAKLGMHGASRPKSSRRPSSAGGERLSKEEIDRILDKIGKEGMGALTPRERELLKKATRG